MEPPGTVFTCCNAYEFAPVGNVKQSTLADIFHGPSMSKIRDQFSHGEIPHQCQLCVNEEKLGQISLRESSLIKYPHITPTHEKKLKFLGLRLSNACNYACRTCSPDLSTAWYKDALAANKKVSRETIKAFTNTEDFLVQLTESVDDLEIIYLAGGEPLITPEVQSMLEFLIFRGRQDIELIINTNFSRPNEKILKLLTEFKSVHLCLSLDAMGVQGEYMRHGMNWVETESRIVLFLEKYPSMLLKLTPTVSIFNIFHLSDFLDYVLSKKYFRPLDIILKPVTSPTNFNFQIMPESMKKRAADKLKLFQMYLMTTYKNPNDQGLAHQIKGLISALNENLEMNEISGFLHEVRTFDRIRSQKVFEVFPELKELDLP